MSEHVTTVMSSYTINSVISMYKEILVNMLHATLGYWAVDLRFYAVRTANDRPEVNRSCSQVIIVTSFDSVG